MEMKVPGKLMIAGEFAVLEPYQKLVVTAVNRFVYVKVEQSKQNELSLTDYSLHHIFWELENNKIVLGKIDHRMQFVKNALETTYRYLSEKKIRTYPIALSIRSELDDTSGVKYGLGSSAAVVTGVVRAVLTEFLSEVPDNLLIFKLASIAHVQTQGNGSGADIAASTYHGVLEYTSFQAEWLLEEMSSTTNISALVEKDWTYLSIQQVFIPPQLNMYVAWTGTAASTKHLVAEIKQMQNKSYEAFLASSKEAVASIIQGMKDENVELFLGGIRENRIALAKLGEAAGVEIETRKLYVLAIEAEKMNGAGKLSGAGGGDCGIVFIPKNTNPATLYEGWREKGISPLDLAVYNG